MHWSDRATPWAQSAVDYQMVAYLLIRKSNIACLADDATPAVDLASAAQDVRGGIEPRICASAAQQELHALDVALMARWPDQPDTRALHDALHDALAASAAAGTPW